MKKFLEGGSEVSEFLFKEVGSSSIAEDFTGHGVDGSGGFITVSLCDTCHAFALGEEAADNAVIAFIGTTFTRGKGVAIVDRQAPVAVLIMLHTMAVLEL